MKQSVIEKLNLVKSVLNLNPTISNRDIAKATGIPAGTIQYYLKLLGVKRDRLEQQKINNTCREKQLTINTIAEQIILGSILGDGYISPYRNPKNTKLKLNSCLCIRHGIKQYDYVLYLKSLFENNGIKCYIRDIKCNKKHFINNIEVVFNGGIDLITQRNVSFNIYRDLFYKDKKIIDNYIYKLDALGLAIWYMDDGCITGKRRSAVFHTECFSIDDLKIIQNMLYQNFGIETTLNKSGKDGQFVIYIRTKSLKNFVNIVSPYIPECMRYKLAFNSVKLGIK